MLLKNGEKFNLDDKKLSEYNREMTFMIPAEKVYRNKDMDNRIEGPSEWGVNPEFTLTTGEGVSNRYRYFESDSFDPDTKKTSYEPVQILFGQRMHIISRDAEFNWFMCNHPSNENHKLRTDGSGKLKNVPIRFRTYDPKAKGHESYKRAGAMKEMMNLLDEKEGWKLVNLRAACHAIASDDSANRHIPRAILQWEEVQTEEDAVILRGALQDMAMLDPVYVRDRVVHSSKMKVSKDIDRLMSGNKEVGILEFNQKDKVWYFTIGADKTAIHGPVPKEAEPKNSLLKKAVEDANLAERLSMFAKAIPEFQD